MCTGLLIGFGGLSKFTNAFLAFGLLAYLIATQKGRGYLRTPLPFLAVAAALLPLLPYLFWNLQNDWLGLVRQGARLVPADFSARRLGEYVALLLLAPTPLVTWFAFRALKGPPQDSALLMWSTAPLSLYFVFHATHAPVQANWIVLLQAAFAILAPFGLARAKRLWTKATLGIAFLMSVGLVATAFNPVTPIGTNNNPPNQTRGWPATKGAMAELLQKTGATWIATTDYALTGSLALRFPQVPVWSVSELQRYGFRGRFPAELCTAPGLLIARTMQSQSMSNPAADIFEKVEASQTVLRAQNGVTLMQYDLTPVVGVKIAALCPG